MSPHAWKTLVRYVISSAVIFIVACRIAAAGQRGKSPVPLWHADLQGYDYNDTKPWSEAMNRISLAFTSYRALVLTYYFGQDLALLVFFSAPHWHQAYHSQLANCIGDVPNTQRPLYCAR